MKTIFFEKKNHKQKKYQRKFTDDAHPKMHFSLSPPLPKADFTALTSANKNNIFNITNDNYNYNKNINNINNFNNNNNNSYQLVTVTNDEKSIMTTENEVTSDYKQWLHAMKLVAHLPGGMPPEFRRKLWLSLADKYLKSKNIDWVKEEEKCFCEKWREDDEELGIQIVKDLHRTGSNLCTGPTGSINQAKLKRILLGYARYNPEVGYCQGFNMLGALILQVMDRNEFESMKVMIYLVEGVLPLGYFHGSMGGLQADMGVFRELMQTKLPRLAKHLQKLQGPVENAYEPPLTNVFTMQWFLTLFCTCLPMTCVLRVWDLVLIEGSDVLLRTALVLWGLLEDRVVSARTADDFYCKMGSFSEELLNGHLIDSNGLIEKVVLLGPIPDIQRLRDKHLYNIAPLRNKPGLHSLYYDDEEGQSDEESRLAVATVWGVPWGRRGSSDKQNSKQQPVESKERIALDISLLKKQYDRLRERQKQAQLILTTACNTARQTASPVINNNNPNMPVNQLLFGRQPIVTNRGNRIGAPANLIPPARKPSLPAVLQSTKLPARQLRRGETLNWRDTDLTKQKHRDSLTWKEIKADRQSILQEDVATKTKQPQKLRSRLGKSDSSSYSEESEEEGDGNGSSTDTSLCDEDDVMKSTDDKTLSSLENSPKRRSKTPRRKKALLESVKNKTQHVEKERPKSWAPSSQEIPFILMSSDSPQQSGDEKYDTENETAKLIVEDRLTKNKSLDEADWTEFKCSTLRDELVADETASTPVKTNVFKPDFETKFIEDEGDEKIGDRITKLHLNSNGITNRYFERVNSIERPKKLNLFYSLNEEDSIRNAYSDDQINPISKYSSSEPSMPGKEAQERSWKSTKETDLITFEMEENPKVKIENYEISSNSPDILRDTVKNETMPKGHFSNNLASEMSDSESKRNTILDRLKNKRRDPRRMTLARSSTIDIEERYKSLEQSEILQKYENAEIQQNRKSIPSTADLEERFSILERQMSGNGSKSKNLENLEDVQFYTASDNRTSSRLVSEKPFTTLSKEISATDVNATMKDSSYLKNTNEKENNSTKKLNEDTKPNQSQQESESETTEIETKNIKSEKLRKNDEKPQLKKLPSTAELEDRFNALERRLSAQKSPSKPKKEPPDGSESSEHYREEIFDEKREINKQAEIKKTTKEKNRNHNVSELDEQTEEEVKQLEKTLRSQTDDNITEVIKTENIKDNQREEKIKTLDIRYDKNDDRQIDGEENLLTKENKNDISQNKNEQQNKRNDVRKSEKDPKVSTHDQAKKPIPQRESANVNKSPEQKTANHRKSPPTTEELESRYRAIEKQLSVNRIESEDIDQEITAQKELSKVEQVPVAANPKTSNNRMLRSELLQEKQKLSLKENSNKETEMLNKSKKGQVDSTEQNQDKADEKQKNINENKKNKLIAEEINYGPNKRRGSEPPSTEDLEKRFENLKRRMSSRAIAEKTLSKSEMLAKYSYRSECEEFRESADETECVKSIDMEKITKKENMKSNIIRQKEIQQKPPTTEDLESRFDALQLHSEIKTPQKKDSYADEVSTTNPRKAGKLKQFSKSVTECFNDNESFKIPIAPPLPISHNTEALNLIIPINNRRSLQRALVEELQSKMKTSPDNANLKPSVINPNRKIPIIKNTNQNKTIDGTSKTHAKSASLWSENNELWQQKKTVRRFSDFPSRADLENRLEFLERQLNEKFEKQRCVSDSEVTSMKSIGAQTIKPHYPDMPSTSKSQPTPPNNLEQRVQALEKQLSENSLKLLEAVRQMTQEQVTTEDVSLSRHISTEFVDPTGKELVRFTNFGDVEDTETHKPFNINIHIKMSVKNQENENVKKSERLPSTEELEKRLQVLEQQIKETKLQELEIVQDNKLEKTFEKKENFKRNDDARKQETVAKETLVKKANEKIETIKKKENFKSKQSLDEKEEVIDNKENPQNNKILESDSSEEKIDLEKPADVFKEKHDAKEIIAKKEIKCEKPLENNQSEVKVEQEKLNDKESSVCRNESENVEKNSKKNNEKIHKENHKISESKTINTSEISACKEENKTIDECQENITTTVKSVETTKPVEEKKEQDTQNETTEKNEKYEPKTEMNENLVDVSDVGRINPNNKTVVLLMDNEPKAVKVRRLTRANTEELEGLFQALEKQLNDRNLIKSDDGKLIHAFEINEKLRNESQKISNLTQEIEKLTNVEKVEIEEKLNEKTKIAEDVKNMEKIETKSQQESFDWGPDPVKRHLKRKTVYLPSTKELEARFRSFERQIKFLEDVEKIDVEQRLIEIERKIKLQYSLSHEKDLNKFLELCDGKEIDEPELTNNAKSKDEHRSRSPKNTRAQQQSRTPHSSPGRKSKQSPYQSPVRTYESTYISPERSNKKSPYTSPVKSKKHSPYTSPLRSVACDDSYIPSTENLEYRFRALELKRSTDNFEKSKKDLVLRKQPIHPLEILLDPSPDDSNIPTTGELEHRMRILEENRKTPTSPRASRSKSPKYQSAIESPDMSPNYHRDLPTADELEARVRALEKDHCFDFKTQKTYKEFNQKLKNAISPSLSFEEYQVIKSREQSPKRKSALRESEYDGRSTDHGLRSTSPKVIRFAEETDDFDEENARFFERTVRNKDEVIEIIEENSKILHRILKKTFTDSNSSIYSTLAAAEGLEARGARLLRETSPMRRTGTHTGVPLRTDLNINDRLDSIKNSIKSIDHLCEQKPYKKEKCQRYIDSLFTDSVHFTKKNSLEDLRRKDYGPSIRISDHCERPSGRTIGSADSIRSTSPLRAAIPLHHRSNRELRRDVSPRRRRDEELDELESRVRRENMLPTSYFLDNSNVSRDNSLTQFYKVDRQLDQYKYDDERYLSNSRSTSRSPLRSPYGSTDMMMHKTTTNTTKTFPTISSHLDIDRPDEPYRSPSKNLSGYEFFKRPSNITPVYNPGKLEIRHTSVTSTFYDRLLAEKQIEKTLTRTPTKSPVVSPSITSKSYTDLHQSSKNISLITPNKKSPTSVNNNSQIDSIPKTVSPDHTETCLTTTTTSANISQAQHHHQPFSYTNPLPYTISSNTTTSLLTSQKQINGSPSFNSPNTSTSVTTCSTSTLGNSVFSVSTYNPMSIYTNNQITSSNIKTIPVEAINSIDSSISISKGVYNPVMPFIMRQPQDTATITSLNVLEQNLPITMATSISPTIKTGNFPKL